MCVAPGLQSSGKQTRPFNTTVSSGSSTAAHKADWVSRDTSTAAHSTRKRTPTLRLKIEITFVVLGMFHTPFSVLSFSETPRLLVRNILSTLAQGAYWS